MDKPESPKLPISDQILCQRIARLSRLQPMPEKSKNALLAKLQSLPSAPPHKPDRLAFPDASSDPS